MSSTPARVGLGLATMGLSEAGGLKPLAEALMPKVPSPPGVSPAPKVEDKAIQEAAAEAARRRQRARGFRSTILSQNFLEPMSGALKQTLGS
jgi:hypothetical protein